jgi:hypothetical protein
MNGDQLPDVMVASPSCDCPPILSLWWHISAFQGGQSVPPPQDWHLQLLLTWVSSNHGSRMWLLWIHINYVQLHILVMFKDAVISVLLITNGDHRYKYRPNFA